MAASRIDFEEMVRTHQSMVFSLALHFLRDRAIAEEVAQDVFLHLHQKLDELKSPDHVRFWLRRVATHRCIDASRRRKLRPGITLDDIAEPGHDPETADPLLRDNLRKVVAGLPEKARAMIVLRYQEEMEPTQIAETLGVPVSTVKSLLHRSLVMLRGKLERRLSGAGGNLLWKEKTL